LTVLANSNVDMINATDDEGENVITVITTHLLFGEISFQPRGLSKQTRKLMVSEKICEIVSSLLSFQPVNISLRKTNINEFTGKFFQQTSKTIENESEMFAMANDE
jgi:hypothetical protein